METLIIDSSNIEELNGYCKSEIAILTHEIKQYYPRYSKWLKKVFKEVSTDRRKIILLKESDKIIGLAIIKVDIRIKLCSFIVRKEYRGKGYGDQLMNIVINRFSKNPIATLNEKLFYQLRSLLIKYNFQYSKIEQGVYKKNDTEIYFNL